MGFVGGIISDVTDLDAEDGECRIFISAQYWYLFDNYSLFGDRSLPIRLGEYYGVDVKPLVKFEYVEFFCQNCILSCFVRTA